MASIRGRLTGYILIGLISLLLLAGFFIEHLIRVALDKDFDQALLAKARVLVTLTEQEPDKLEFDFEKDAMPEYSADESPEYFQLLTQAGTLVAKSESLGDGQLPDAKPKDQSPVFTDVLLPDGRPGRMVSFLFLPKYDDEQDEDEQGVNEKSDAADTPRERDTGARPVIPLIHIAVAKGLEHLDELIAAIRFVLVIAFLILILSVILLVHMAIRHGLGPLNSIVNQVRSLDASKLQTRISGETNNKELTPIIDQLNDLLERLDSAFQREKRFSGNVAHELRTPIAELRAVAEVGKKWPADEKMVSGFFSDLLDLADDMERTVTNLLTLASLDAGRAEIALELVDLHQLVNKIWKRVGHEAVTRQVILDNKVRPGLQIRTDKNKLVLILANLLTNSLSYSPKGSTIEIDAQEHEAKIQFTVSNQTVDLTEQDLPMMFERFWRKEQVSSSEGHHAGLGLALVKALAELLNLKVYSNLDREGRFTMTMQGLPTAV